jgi:hypothetical protein
VASIPEPTADYNGNGVVDAADYVAWRKNGGAQTEYQAWLTNFGHGQSETTGDFNLDGQINAADYVALRKTGGSQQDYNLWRTNFGATTAGAAAVAPSGATTVPEPTSVALAALAFLPLACRLRGFNRRAAGARQRHVGFVAGLPLPHDSAVACRP